jgi:hypothetical protein
VTSAPFPISSSHSVATSNAASGPATARSELLAIFQKVKNGTPLQASEQNFLNQSHSRTLAETFGDWCSSFFGPPPDEASVQAIDSLAEQILKKTWSGKEALDRVEQKILAVYQPTDREAASLAKLIKSCQSREVSFADTLVTFHQANGRTPERGELIDMVAKFNQEMLPKVPLAGTVVARVNAFALGQERKTDYEIRYNRQGLLEIVEGPIAPLDLSCAQTLNKAQREDMAALYNDLLSNATYNNLGELLEFIKYVNENPQLTFKDAYASYHPDLPAIFDKYQGGDCISLAAKFAKELEKKGIQAENLAVTLIRGNQWSVLPVPGEEKPKWTSYSNAVNGVDHTSSICLFTDEKGKKGAMKFECSFEEGLEDEIVEYLGDGTKSGVQKFLEANQARASADRPNVVIDCGYIGKARLQGRFKALVKRGEKQIFGVDFLHDNLYINSSWSKTMTGLPINARGMVSIPLEDLAHPEETGVYRIDGVATTLTHRQALRLILEKVGPELNLPKDAEENLIILAQNRKLLFQEFFLKPLPLIKAHYDDLLVIHKKLTELKPTMEWTEEFGTLTREYGDLIESVSDSTNSVELGQRIANFKAKVLIL